MIEGDTVLELLKETYIANMYFTKSARKFICCEKINLFLEQFRRRSIFDGIRN